MAELGFEASRLDTVLKPKISDSDRENLWNSVTKIVERSVLFDNSTQLVLGYVQSGKTTAMTALAAHASDCGFNVVVSLMGSTNLLLEQNKSRLSQGLGISERNDYRWIEFASPKGQTTKRKIQEKILAQKLVFIPILKHWKRIQDLADIMSQLELETSKVLVLDDEADQMSLNTLVKKNDVSRTYESILNLKSVLPHHNYIQFTATPYAPMLLNSNDPLAPEHVEILKPGTGYTGGKEFFIDNQERVIRKIPITDVEASKSAKLSELPNSLVNALASFLSGVALMKTNAPDVHPVSMLIHATHRNELQARYEYLVSRQIAKWEEALSTGALPEYISIERDKLVARGAVDVPEKVFVSNLKEILRDKAIWLVNSASDVEKVVWNESPVHILVGGNKLDRGFTVEGLTVTYMNRKPSIQIDTLEQRARAFGYRAELMPYCQFFASHETVRILKGIVETEYDLRARLTDWFEAGGSVEGWSREVGLLLPAGTQPTRNNVIQGLDQQYAAGGWHWPRTLDLSSDAISSNSRLVENLGILSAPPQNYGRLSHRTKEISVDDLVQFLMNWKYPKSNIGFDFDKVMERIQRLRNSVSSVSCVLMAREDGSARVRSYRVDTGFVNLMQGEDLDTTSDDFYPGDRAVPFITTRPSQLAIQIHKVKMRDSHPTGETLFTFLTYLGDNKLARKARND